MSQKILTNEVRKSIEESVLCWLATSDAAGFPNVSPKEMFVHHSGNAVLVANIASPNSERNVLVNPRVCLSFVHVLKQKGYKLHGAARVVQPSDAEFNDLTEKLYALGGREFEIRSVFVITVDKASPIVAPSYWLFPETTEQSQVEKAKQQYGV